MVHPGGRPTDYNEEIAEEICIAISSHPLGLESICEFYNHFPRWRTIYVWLNKHPQFMQKYMRARRLQTHLLLDNTIDIANEHANQEDDNLIKINRARLRIDTYKFNAVRLNPDDYGDKKELKGDINLKDTTPKMNEHKKAYERDREY